MSDNHWFPPRLVATSSYCPCNSGPLGPLTFAWASNRTERGGWIFMGRILIPKKTWQFCTNSCDCWESAEYFRWCSEVFAPLHCRRDPVSWWQAVEVCLQLASWISKSRKFHKKQQNVIQLPSLWLVWFKFSKGKRRFLSCGEKMEHDGSNFFLFGSWLSTPTDD